MTNAGDIWSQIGQGNQMVQGKRGSNPIRFGSKVWLSLDMSCVLRAHRMLQMRGSRNIKSRPRISRGTNGRFRDAIGAEVKQLKHTVQSICKPENFAFSSLAIFFLLRPGAEARLSTSDMQRLSRACPLPVKCCSFRRYLFLFFFNDKWMDICSFGSVFLFFDLL